MSNLTLNNLARFQAKLQVANTDSSPSTVGGITRLPLESIELPPHQPRRYFSPQELEKLKISLATSGLLNPVIVRPFKNGQYQLVAGERRYRAALALGWKEIAVNILELDDQRASQVSLIENLQREDLNPLDQTEGILALLEWRLQKSTPDVLKILYRLHNEHTGKVSTKNVFGSADHQEIEAVFNELGQLDWLSFVVCRLPLLHLPKDILAVVRTGQLAYTKAKAIARVKDEILRKALISSAIDEQLSLSEIKAKIKELTTKALGEQPQIKISPQDRWKELNSQINRSKLWEDETACQQLQSLMEQIESLVQSKIQAKS